MPHGDMFLKIKGQKHGLIKGEAKDKEHMDEIDVLAWSWGMEGSNVHSVTPTGKRTIQAVKITKRVDKASTALMSCLASNELIKEVVLAVRKAGGSGPLEYFKITMENARISSLFERSGEGADPATLNEDLTIAFAKVTVEYREQSEEGLGTGVMSFEDEISPDQQ